MKLARHVLLLAAAILTAAQCLAADTDAVSCVGMQPGREQVFWGDLHIHTRWSMDAFVFGALAEPAAAYRFARGEPQTLAGRELRIDRPLDFAAVTDHAEYFGVMNLCTSARDDISYCNTLRATSDGKSLRGFYEMFLPYVSTGRPICPAGEDCQVAQLDLWQRTAAAANEANRPCEFTTFVANEWTPSPGGLHWHRNLIFASDVVPERPINSIHEPRQEDLWRALDTRCDTDAGCEVVAIPHNGNMSLGGAFTTQAASVAELRLRARFERALEIHQHKGNSECYPGAGLNDELCDFETVFPPPISRRLAAGDDPLTAEDQEALASGYARNVLARGLELEARHGVNPFRYAFVGSTDNHSGRAGYVAEAGWQGAIGIYDAPGGPGVNPVYNPGGVAGIWAGENTRASLFSALQRGETFATSGPRMPLRLLLDHGAAPGADPCSAPGADTVRMGSSTFAASSTPVLTVQVMSDGVALERLQIIKLSLPRDGVVSQRIVDFEPAGAAQEHHWCLRWPDRDHRADEPALWYARVLQRPTPRWDYATSTRMIRERAWSSPIFWEPPAAR